MADRSHLILFPVLGGKWLATDVLGVRFPLSAVLSCLPAQLVL